MRTRRADRLVERIVAHGAEGLAVAGAETLDRGGVENDLADRLQHQLAGGFGGALGQRVEEAQALQLVAEEVEPQGLFPARRTEEQTSALPELNRNTYALL